MLKPTVVVGTGSGTSLDSSQQKKEEGGLQFTAKHGEGWLFREEFTCFEGRGTTATDFCRGWSSPAAGGHQI